MLKLTASPFSTNEARKRMIQTLIEKSKYLDDENFLKPVKKKKKPKRKSKSKSRQRISYSDYNRLLTLTQNKSASHPSRHGDDEDTPEWAKLARVSTIPNR